MSLHMTRTHPQFVDGCFGCKASTLKFSDMQIHAVAHRDEKELNAYSAARRQGVQPRSTRMADITGALRASDVAGMAVTAR